MDRKNTKASHMVVFLKYSVKFFKEIFNKNKSIKINFFKKQKKTFNDIILTASIFNLKLNTPIRLSEKIHVSLLNCERERQLERQ